MEEELNLEELTEQEMDVVMTVFRSYETGLREATIYPKVGITLNRGGGENEKSKETPVN